VELASVSRTAKVFGALVEGANAALGLLKGVIAMHGVELPDEAVSLGKDALGLVGKNREFNEMLAHAVAVAEIESAESVAEIDALYTKSEQMHKDHSIMISRAEALQKVCIEAMNARIKKQQDGGASTEHNTEAEPAAAEPQQSDPEADDKKPAAKPKPGIGSLAMSALDAEDKAEGEDLGGFKMVANGVSSVLDPLKAIKATLEARESIKHLGEAKKEQKAAEEAVALHLAKHGGGKPIPGGAPAPKQ
jgi:hypothetical protein